VIRLVGAVLAEQQEEGSPPSDYLSLDTLALTRRLGGRG
jgi:hypothetical protein